MTNEKKTEKEPESNDEQEEKDNLAFFDDFHFVLPQKYVTNKPQGSPEDVPPHQKR